MTTWCSVWKVIYILSVFNNVNSSDDVKYVINYPVKLLQPVTGVSFTGEVAENHLTCFGNQDFRPATYLEGMYCLSGAAWIYPLYSCQSLWGSRSVSVSVEGSVEIYRMEKLPRESAHVMLNASHWLHLDSPRGLFAREIVNVDASPVYLCVRSNDWQDRFNSSQFTLQFRPAYIRGRDREATMREMLSMAVFLLGLSVAWLRPLLKAHWVASLAFSHGLNVFIAVVSFSATILLLTPFVLTRRNRDRARYAYKLYFSFMQVRPLRHGTSCLGRYVSDPPLTARGGGGNSLSTRLAALPRPVLFLSAGVRGLRGLLRRLSVHWLRQGAQKRPAAGNVATAGGRGGCCAL